MKKSRLLGAVCACVLAFYLPSSSYAASVINPGPQPGGVVTPYTDLNGFTKLDVQFQSNVPIIIDFLNLAPDDLLNISTLSNDTGLAWSGIDFTFVNSTILTPIDLTPATGVVDGIFFDGGLDFFPGIITSVTISFEPASPEHVGLFDLFFELATPDNQPYSLVITPTAVPLPAAVWLFGSGLLGLIGISRRKKAA